MRINVWYATSLLDPTRNRVRSRRQPQEIAHMGALEPDRHAQLATAKALTTIASSLNTHTAVLSSGASRRHTAYPHTHQVPGAWTSTSYGGRTTVVAVGNRPIGVDVERTGQHHRVLSRRLGVDDPQSDDEAVRRWCAGEAIAKCAALSMWQLLRERPQLDLDDGHHVINGFDVCVSTALLDLGLQMALAWRGHTVANVHVHDVTHLLARADEGSASPVTREPLRQR